MFNIFLGRFQRYILIALTLMVRFPDNFVIVSPIMAPRPKTTLHSKVYIGAHNYESGLSH